MHGTPIRIEDSPRRVRAQLSGRIVADSRSPKLVYGIERLPRYYFPREHVDAGLLVEAGYLDHDRVGRTQLYHVEAGDRRSEKSVRIHVEHPELSALATIEWSAMDHWYEEDEEVFVHPVDPYVRVDVRDSTRHVQVFVDGVELADTRAPRLLFETGLPTQFYLPKTDVRMDLLVPSPRRTACPYKGQAHYWHVETASGRHSDLVWCYETTRYEALKVAGMLCFFDERVEMVIDGQTQRRVP